MHTRTKKTLLLIALPLLLVAAFFALRTAKLYLGAASIACRLRGLGPLPIELYWKWTNHTVEMRETRITGESSGGVEVRTYTPIGVEDPPTVVLVHGFSPDGMREHTMAGVGHDLAADGFQVYVPNLPPLQHMLIVPEVLTEIGDTVRWARQHSTHRVALIGVSFGGGLSLRVASMPQYAQDLGTVLVMGGYNSVPRLCDYFTGKGSVEPDGSVYDQTPSSLGFLVMALQHMDEEVPPEDAAGVSDLTRRLVFEKVLSPEFRAQMAKYSARVQQSFLQLVTVTPEQDARYQEIFMRHRETYESVSPHRHLAGVNAEVFILHGKVDVLIPPSEAEWNEYELRTAGKEVHLTLSPLFSHSGVNGGTTKHDKWQLVSMFAHILTAMHHNI